MSKTIKLLLIEDDENDVRIILRELRKAGLNYEWMRVDNESDLVSALSQQDWDAVISDYFMPGFSGMDALIITQNSGIDLPFIVVSGAIGEETAVRMIKAGAHDYVMKSQLNRLPQVIQREIQQERERAQRKQAESAYLESVKNYQLLVENNPAPTIVVQDGLIKFSNLAALGLFKAGCPEILLNQPLAKFLMEDTGRFVQEMDPGNPAPEVSMPFREQPLLCLDGKFVTVEITTLPTHVNGKPATLHLLHDISERKIHEREIGRVNRLYSVLSQINQNLLRVDDEQSFLDATCQAITSQGGFELAWIARLGEQSRAITPAACSGSAKDYIYGVVISTDENQKEGRGPLGTALREGHPVIVNQIEDEPRMDPWKSRNDQFGIRSTASFPIFLQNHIWGALAVYSKEVNFFQDRESQLLVEVAESIGFGLAFLERENERKTIETNLQIAYTHLEEAQRIAHIGSYEYELDQQYLTLSDEVFRIFQINPKNFKGNFSDVFSFVHPNDQQRILKFVDKAIAGRTNLMFEFRIKRDNGEERYLQTCMEPMLDHNGTLVRLVGTIQDITELHLSQITLRESEEKFRQLAENINEVFILLDLERDKITYLSPGFERIWGRSKQEFISVPSSFLEWVHPLDKALTNNLIDRVMENGTQIKHEFRILRPDGSMRWIQLSGYPIFNSANQVTRIAAIAEDITDRKELETEAKLQEEELRRRTQELEILADLSSTMRKTQTRIEMIDVLCQKSRLALNARSAYFSIFQNNVLYFQDDQANGGIQINLSQQKPNDLLWSIIHKGTALYIENFTDEIGANLPEELPIFDLPCKAIGLIPLLSGSITVGLFILCFDNPKTFNIHEKQLAASIAEMAGNALYRTMVTEMLEQLLVNRTRDLESIYEISSVAGTTQDLAEALSKALDLTLDAVSAKIGAIYLVDEKNKPVSAAQIGLPAELHQLLQQSDPFPLEQKVICSKLPLVLRNYATISDNKHESSIDRCFSYTGIPMRIRDQVVGVLSLWSIDEELFSLEEMTLLSFIADHLGLVIQNSRLIQKAEKDAVLEERSRLARDLHDSITQSLYSATLFTAGAKELVKLEKKEQTLQYLENIGQITHQALIEMRLMVYELRSPSMIQNGMIGALQNRLDAVERRSKINATLDVDPGVHFSPKMEQQLFSIIIEALNNALKHAHATQVFIHLRRGMDGIEIIVEDDGCGFDVASTANSGGFGLHTMRERAEKIGGIFTIQSIPGKGTRIEIILAAAPQYEVMTDE